MLKQKATCYPQNTGSETIFIEFRVNRPFDLDLLLFVISVVAKLKFRPKALFCLSGSAGGIFKILANVNMRSQFDFGEQKTVFGENSVAIHNPDGKNTYENFKSNKPFSQTPIK